MADPTDKHKLRALKRAVEQTDLPYAEIAREIGYKSVGVVKVLRHRHNMRRRKKSAADRQEA